MDTQGEIGHILSTLKEQSPAGYAIALHVRFTTPTFLFQSYPKEWIDHYSQNGLVMRDPTVHWGFENLGTVRWSDLAPLDSAGVIAAAQAHGMRFGFTCAVERDGTRSLSSFTRNDRDFTDAEIGSIAGSMARLHDLTARGPTLSAETREALRRLSITFTHP